MPEKKRPSPKPKPAEKPESAPKKTAPRAAKPKAPAPEPARPVAARKPGQKPAPVVETETPGPVRQAPTAAGRPPKVGPAPPKPDSRIASPGNLSILMVSSEAHPFAKTGGLAEVAGALPHALARLGHDVTLVLPKYRGIDVTGATNERAVLTFADRDVAVTFHERRLTDRISLVLIDVPALFDREGLYGDATGDYPDNAWRFAVFGRAVLEYPRLRRSRPSIIHAHDWQTGLVPVYQKMHLSPDPFVGGVPVVFTIHNLAFQGLFPAATLPSLGLGWDVFNVDALEYWGKISYLKGGINFSEKITTVSPRYAKEILGPELGFGFHGVLVRRAEDLVGILNGIDVDRWNPTKDPFVPASFTADDLSGKAAARRALLETVALPVDDPRPVIGLISRLTAQKGFDLFADASADLMALDARWVMLGSGERRYEDHWRELAGRHPDRVVATIGFDERLAHLIEAGADLFLMPSQFEPCGLNQLYSLRYGTVPVVRAVGGLDDTVVDADDQPGRGTGFKFTEYTPLALAAALQRALAAFNNPRRWKEIQRRGMRQDHSWDASAAEYVKVYRAILPAGQPAR